MKCHEMLSRGGLYAIVGVALILMPAWASAAPRSAKSAPQAKIAVFTLGGTITEKPQGEDILFGTQSESFHDLLTRLRKVEKDDAVKAVVLVASGTSLGTSQVEEVRQVLDRIKHAGKPVWVNADSLTMRDYLLLSAASRLSVVPTGDIWINGIYGESPYLRGLLDKIGVVPDYTTCGAYKSAAEMFMRTGPSPAAQENLDWLMDGIYETYLQLIATGRDVSTKQVRAWIDQGVYSAEKAKELGIIDAVEHRQDFVDQLQRKYGKDVRFDKKYGKKKSADIDLSSPFGLLKFYADLLTGGRKAKSTKDAIAIVYVEGLILPGKSDPSPFPMLEGGLAYSTPIRKALDEAAADDTIKGVVLRVDSPGGSAVASEIIMNATQRVAAKKPFVVSMGNVAGSGGYYVACAARTIFADSSTITGSIGVVAGKLATQSMWSKIGVNWKPVQRGANAGMLTSGEPFTAKQRATLQTWMNEIYAVFKGHVTAIRGQKLKKPIDELAGGRVYTGKQALELGLVDKVGGLEDAIQHVARQAKLKKFEVRILPRPKNLIELLMSSMTGDSDDDMSLSLAHQPWTGGSGSLIETALPYLKGLEPLRLRGVLTALGQLQALQKEHVLMAMPVVEIKD